MQSKVLWAVVLGAVTLGLEAGCAGSDGARGDSTGSGGASGGAGAAGQGGTAGIDAGLDGDDGLDDRLDDRLFLPEGLPNTNQNGQDVGLASATIDLAPGGTWTFQTDAVDDPGVGYVASATGTLP
jgi:hypothetical protein